MKEKLSKINIKTKQELKDKVIEIKEEIEGSFIENCIYSMKKRLKEVIKAKRDKIMYLIYFNDSSNIIVIFFHDIFEKICLYFQKKFCRYFRSDPCIRNEEQVLVNTEYLAKQMNDIMTQQVNKDKINGTLFS